jgi:ATP-binding cassette subfamily B (MDR/TAP) protein 1
MKTYRGELFDSTMCQDMTFFDQPEHGAGALASRLSSEPTSLQDLISMNLILMLVNIFNLLSSTILAIATGWKLGLVLGLGALPPLVVSGYVRIRLEFKFDEDTAARFASSSALASEAVLAIRTVSSLALERAIVDRYQSMLSGIAKKSIASLGWKMLFYALSQSISYLAMGLGFWYGGQLVSTGEYTNAQFYIVFVAIIFSGESAASFFQYTTSITKARTAMNYIFKLRRGRVICDEHSEVHAGGHDSPTPSSFDTRRQIKVGDKGGMAVECNKLSFAYPLRPGASVLRDIDVSITPGKLIAFVGASGCGKSTMIALLERFYDPTTGSIRADGEDIRTLDRRRYRSDVALVQQEPVLYQGSIRDNIALGIEDVAADDADRRASVAGSINSGQHHDDDAIIEACRQANIWDFVASLPEGLATPCGNQGLALSGGQRQRIAIARALVRSPRLLLLDEATSALDTESERIVQAALDRAAAGRTTVAVAHRLSTIRDANAIVVFERGRVAQVGTHDELVARRGVYYAMVLGQSLDREASTL